MSNPQNSKQNEKYPKVNHSSFGQEQTYCND